MKEFLVIYGDKWNKWGSEMKTLIKELGGTWNENKVEFNIDIKQNFEKFGVLKFGSILGDIGTWDDNSGIGIVKIFKIKEEVMLIFRNYNDIIIQTGIKHKCLVQKVWIEDNEESKVRILCNNKKRNFLIKIEDLQYSTGFVKSWLKILN